MVGSWFFLLPFNLIAYKIIATFFCCCSRSFKGTSLLRTYFYQSYLKENSNGHFKNGMKNYFLEKKNKCWGKKEDRVKLTKLLDSSNRWKAEATQQLKDYAFKPEVS